MTEGQGITPLRELHPRNAIASAVMADAMPRPDPEVYEGQADHYRDMDTRYLQVSPFREWWRWCVYQFEYHNISMGEYASPSMNGICATEQMAIDEGMRALDTILHAKYEDRHPFPAWAWDREGDFA